MGDIQVFDGIECYEENGTVFLRLETCARGLGFTQEKNGVVYIRWETVENYLASFNFPTSWENSGNGTDNKRPEYIPENIFYRLAMKAKNAVAESFQAKVADEIIPAIRRTGSYNTKQTLSEDLKAIQVVLEPAGIKGNQLSLALDKVYKSYTGRSALQMAGIQLIAPTKHPILTPTEIGKHFGVSGKKINEFLLKAEYQKKVGKGYEPLELGEAFAVMQDTNKRHSDGTPVRQLKWDSTILKELEEYFPELPF